MHSYKIIFYEIPTEYSSNKSTLIKNLNEDNFWFFAKRTFSRAVTKKNWKYINTLFFIIKYIGQMRILEYGLIWSLNSCFDFQSNKNISKLLQFWLFGYYALTLFSHWINMIDRGLDLLNFLFIWNIFYWIGF